MNANQAIRSILTCPGVDAVTYRLGDGGKQLVSCEQVVQTISGTVVSRMQASGETAEEATENLKKNIEHIAQLQAKILTMNSN